MHFLGKLRQAGALIAAGAILAGCTINIGGGETIPDGSSTGGVPSADAAADDTDLAAVATAPEAEPVIPPLGEFDRNNPNYDQFNPCTEIPHSFLKSVGLLERKPIPKYADEDGVCGFSIDEKYGSVTVSLRGNDWGFEQYQYLNGEFDWSETQEARPVLLHRDDMFQGTTCSAVIETKRGTFHTMFQSNKYEESDHDSCDEAERWLLLILAKDGKNGN